MQRVPGLLGQINRIDLLSGARSENGQSDHDEGGSMKKNTPEQSRKIQNLMAALRREKQKPNERAFPKFIPGMTGGDYIRRYNALNCGQYRTRITLDFLPDTLVNPSPVYDPLILLCTEETIE